jgi:hypothetical protein
MNEFVRLEATLYMVIYVCVYIGLSVYIIDWFTVNQL